MKRAMFMKAYDRRLLASLLGEIKLHRNFYGPAKIKEIAGNYLKL